MRLVVMGVAGSGKSTVARVVAERLGARFVEADDVHPPANIAKMAAGVPLDDDDRAPWLDALAADLAGSARVVLACSALKRRYRDVLRRAGDVHVVHLAVEPDRLAARLATRAGHFMGPAMLTSQLDALEPPAADESSTAIVDADQPIEAVVDEVLALVDRWSRPLFADGAPDRDIAPAELDALVRGLADEHLLARGVRRVLLVPPDQTRLHSRAGVITATLFAHLSAAGVDTWVLPAVGTHAAMTPDDALLLFGPTVPFDRLLAHRWRDGLVRLGEIALADLDPMPVEVDDALLVEWDTIVSIGQVVPHEVIGLANFTKNLVIGLGGAPTIHRTHFLGAVSGMESIMGRADTVVRRAVDAAFDRFIAPRVDVLWFLTVMEDTAAGVVARGLFVGRGGSHGTGGAAYRAAADLARAVNVEIVAEPWRRAVCFLDPDEFRTTWLGNKAIYRTRMAMADGGELIVLAPGVRRFGEDPAIDALIRRHGYRGTPATLAAVAADPELAANLGAAAHLIHGSSEGRFRVVYATDPAAGGLTRAEVEGVGYEWRSLPEATAALGLDDGATGGDRVDRSGAPFRFVANPALGLWSTDARLSSAGA